MAAAGPLRKVLERGLYLQRAMSPSLRADSFQHKVSIMRLRLGNSSIHLYTTHSLTKTDVNICYRNGLPVVTIPLPSRREPCEFTLKSMSQNVGDFTKFIKDEDGGVDTVGFFTKDGSRIAKSTLINDLLRTDFQLHINDQTYLVSPPVIHPLSSENAQTLNDVKLLVSQLYSAMIVENYQLEREKELLKKLEDLNMQLAPLEIKAGELSAKADANTNRLSWLGLGLMGLQFGIFARLTWWEYSWDIMEPVTYFATYGTTMAMFAYFVLTKQEYVFPDAKDRQFLLKFHKLAQKEKLDVEKYNQLKDAIAEAEHDLRRLRDPLQLHLPIKEIEKAVKKD